MTSVLPGWQRGCLDVCALVNCFVYALTGRAPSGRIKLVNQRLINWVAWYGYDRTREYDYGFDSFCERMERQMAAMLGVRIYAGFGETKYSSTRAFVIREREKLRAHQTAWFKAMDWLDPVKKEGKARSAGKTTVRLTPGVDVQKGGVYYAVRAWGQAEESWLVDFGRLSSWEDVARVVFNMEVGGIHRNFEPE